MIDYLKIKTTFKDILYLDDTHQYIKPSTGEILTSVTTKIKEFTIPFDKNIIYGYAKKHKRSVASVRKEWDNKRILGTNKGSYIHKYLEDKTQHKIFDHEVPKEIVSSGQVDYFNKAIIKLKVQANAFLEDYSHLISVTNELIVYNNEVSGQIDWLAYNPDTDKMFIVDYKQDKKIDYMSRYNKEFKTPISHLSECEFNKYSLQTSMYRYLFESQTGIELDDSIIVRFHETIDSYEIYKVPYLLDEVKAILEYKSKK